MLDTFATYANIRFNYVGSYSDPVAAAAAAVTLPLGPMVDR